VVADVVMAAGGEVVEDHDLVPARQQGVGEVGSDEARSTGDQHAHGGSLGAGLRTEPNTPRGRPHNVTTTCLAKPPYRSRVCRVTLGTQAKVTSSGQISLPAALRRRWGAARVLVIDRGDYAIVRPMPEDIVGFLRGSITPGETTLADIRAEERADESRREESR